MDGATTSASSSGSSNNKNNAQRWRCDVCLEARFDTYAEAAVHEAACGAPKYSRRKRKRENETKKKMVWRCDVCREAKFETRAEAEAHERGCGAGAPSLDAVDGAKNTGTGSDCRRGDEQEKKAAALPVAKKLPELVDGWMPPVSVMVPPGKLGLTVQFPNHMMGGGAQIDEVHDACPFKYFVRAGDCLLQIDGRDVRTAADIAVGAERTRRITLLRRAKIPKPAVDAFGLQWRGIAPFPFYANSGYRGGMGMGWGSHMSQGPKTNAIAQQAQLPAAKAPKTNAYAQGHKSYAAAQQPQLPAARTDPTHGTSSAKPHTLLRTGCKIKGCALAVHLGGMCQLHSTRGKETGMMCRREACRNLAIYGGVCRKHREKKLCKRDGCPNEATHRGNLCGDHATNKLEWNYALDAQLKRLVTEHGAKKWSWIASHFPGMSAKQCRNRWFNEVDPEIRRDAWTAAENRVILACHQEMGNKWAKMAKLLSGRTDNSIKNYFNFSLKRKLERYLLAQSGSGGTCYLKEGRFFFGADLEKVVTAVSAEASHKKMGPAKGSK